MANWFVAFKVNTDSWYNRIIPILPRGTRIFHPDDVHLTVAFLGDLKQEFIPEVIQTLKKLNCTPVTLHGEKLIALPSQRHFSAICLDFTNHHPEFEVQMEICKKNIFAAAGLQPDTRKFLAHATICRPPRKISVEQKKQILKETLAASNLGVEISVDTIALYTWAEDRGKGRDYRQFKTIFEKNMQ